MARDRNTTEPPDRDAMLQAIDAAAGAGDHAGALEIADRAVGAHPDDAELHHARGVVLRALGRHEDCLASFERAREADPGLADAWLDGAEVLVDEVGDDVGALEVLRDAERVLEDGVVRAELALLRGVALAHLEDLSGALHAFDEAGGLDPENPDVPTERGAALIELLRLEDAEAALREGLRLSEDNARAHQLLAFLLDFTGRRPEAERHFLRASELDPHAPAAPPRLSEEEFDAAVEEALAQVPPRFSRHLANVEIGVENYADREFCRRHDCSPMTLGVHVGTPMPLRQGGEQLPDRIVLFQRAIENVCRDRTEVVKEIVITLKHEIGHFLGFEEHELVERGYE